jgi:hypothetical protein
MPSSGLSGELQHRIACRKYRFKREYYQVTLSDEDLGAWSELGVLGVLVSNPQFFNNHSLFSGINLVNADDMYIAALIIRD